MFPQATLALGDLSSTQVKSGQPAAAEPLMLERGEWVVRSDMWSALYRRCFLFFALQNRGRGRKREMLQVVGILKNSFCKAPKWMTLARHRRLNAEHSQKRTERTGSHSLPLLWLSPDTVLIHTYKAGARESHKDCNSYCYTYCFLVVVGYFGFL